MKTFEHLSNIQRTFIRIALQALIALLILFDVLDTFWGGVISGILVALIINEVLMHWQNRKHNYQAQKMSAKDTEPNIQTH